VPAPNETMGDWFKRAKAQGDPESVLEELGIPGIKYLDGGSRAGGKGTRNFVVFNPDDVKILERK